MSRDPYARRMVIALVSSVVLMSGVLIVDFGIDVNAPSGSAREKFLDKLVGLGWKIGEWLVPGHDLFHFFLWTLCAIAFNAMVFWLILSAWAWIRARFAD